MPIATELKTPYQTNLCPLSIQLQCGTQLTHFTSLDNVSHKNSLKKKKNMTENREQNSAHVEYPRRYQIDGVITTKRQIKFRVSMINTKKSKKKKKRRV